MHSIGVCPHCGARIDPRRVLLITRRVPYTCASCGGESVIARGSGMRAVLAYVAALALPVFALDYLDVPRIVLFAGCAAGALAIPIVFTRLCRFDAAPQRGVTR
jgi:DNA-directed RNA polymerase subunit RPC12/RpoP